MNAQNNLIFDATAADFAVTVLDRSQQIPVIVDFQADWCQPCRTLGPILEAAVRELNGRVVLARIDVDAAPEPAVEYGVESIPAVKIFYRGEVVTEFVGLLSPAEVGKRIAEILPAPEESEVEEANRLLSGGRWEEAERIYQAVREREPAHPGAALGLGIIAYHQSRFEEADGLLASVVPETPGYDQVSGLRGRIYFQKGPAPDLETITAALKENPGDPAALFSLARLYGRGGEYIRALDTLLQVLRIDRGFAEGAAREAYLRILAILGRRSPEGKKYERELSMLLFS